MQGSCEKASAWQAALSLFDSLQGRTFVESMFLLAIHRGKWAEGTTNWGLKEQYDWELAELSSQQK